MVAAVAIESQHRAGIAGALQRFTGLKKLLIGSGNLKVFFFKNILVYQHAVGLTEDGNHEYLAVLAVQQQMTADSTQIEP